MKTTRAEVVGLFVELGFQDAGKWGRSKVLGKIERLSDLIDEEVCGELKNGELCLQLLESVRNGQNIRFRKERKMATKTGAKRGTKKGSAVAGGGAAKGKGTKAKGAKAEAGGKTGSRGKRGETDKDRIYALYLKGGDKKPKEAESLIKQAQAKVKETTVRSWISSWNGGKGLPTSAEE